MAGQDIQTNVVLTADNSQYDQSMVQSAQNTDQLGKSVDGLGAKLDKLTKSAGRKLIGVSAADTAALGATTLAYGAWEKQMSALNSQAAILNKTVSGQQTAFRGYADSVSHLRSEFGMATAEAADLTQTIVKLTSLPSSGVNKLATTFATMGEATGESSTALANSVLQLQKTMGSQPGRETERYANQLTVLAASTGASAQGLADFAQQIAPVARQVGTSQTEVQGLSAAFAKAGQDGYQAMNFYTRMMNDISYAAQSGSPRLNQFAALAGMTTKQFKDTSGLEQFNSILNALNKQGPSAINSLNQLGYEGSRMSKVALTLSQQGGIMGMVGAAKAADRDPGAMSRGSQAAMDNLYHSMSELRIELTKTAEAFGKFWAGPASEFFTGLSKGARLLSELAGSPLGQLASMVAGLAAPFIAFAGAILIAAKAITAFALARSILTGAMSSGFKETAMLTPAARAAMAAEGFVPGVGAGRMSLGAQGANIAERPHWAQRAAYNIGSDVARITGYQSGQAGSMLRTAGGASMYLAGRGMESFVSPQFAAASVRVPGMPFTGGYSDITKRMPIFGAATARESFGMGPTGPITRWGGALKEGWMGAPGTGAAGVAGGATIPGAAAYAASGAADASYWQRLRGAARAGWTGLQAAPLAGPEADIASRIKYAPGVGAAPGISYSPEQVAAMKAAGVTGTKAGFTAAEDATAAQTKNIKAVEGAAASTEKFARTTSMAERGMGTFARGAAQTAVMMGSAGMGLAKFGAGIGKQAYSLVGGNPLLLAGGGILAAYEMGKAYNADTKSAIEPMTGFAQPYLESAGLNALPGAPTAQAADAVSKAQTMRQAYRVTPTEAAAVRGSGFQLQNQNLKGKTAADADEIEAGLAAQWEYGSKSPAFVAGVASDLTNILGPAQAMSMLGRLKSGQAKTPYFLATQAATVGRSGWMDKLGNTLSGSLAQPKVERLTGIIEDTAAQVNATQGPGAAALYRQQAMDKSFQAFNVGLASHTGIGGTGLGAPDLDEVKGAFYKGMLKEMGVDKATLPGDIRDIGTPTSTIEFARKLIVGTQKTTGTGGAFTAPSLPGTPGTVIAPGERGTTTSGKAGILTDDEVKTMLSTAGVSQKKLDSIDLSNRQAVYAAYTQATRNQTPQQVQQQSNVETQMMALTGGTKAFGAQGILGLPSVQKALVTRMGDPNAMYGAVQQVVQGIASQGGTGVQGIGKTLEMLRTAQGVPGAGSEMLMGVLQQQQQNMAMRQPYLSRTQSFAQSADMFQQIQGAPLAGEHGAEIKAQNKADFAASVQDQYNFFKTQLYQQREFNVMRDRGERDFNIQRAYAQEDYNTMRQREEEQYALARSRAIRDFNTSQKEAQQSFDIQRRRAQEDHHHQELLMIEQQAMAYSDAYTRVAVQQTESSPWVVTNLQDQTQRLEQQTQNLNRARQLGISNQAIRMLHLNDPKMAQQLEQNIGEWQNDPKLVAAVNRAVRKNQKAAGTLFKDSSNKDWSEFERTFRQNMARGQSDMDRATRISTRHFHTSLSDMADDNQTMMSQQEEDNEKMMRRQLHAYNKMMEDAAADLARSARTIDGNFEDILTAATKRLSGHAKAQATATLAQFDDLNTKAGPKAVALKQYYANVFGFDWTPPPPLGGGNSTANTGVRGTSDPSMHGFGGHDPTAGRAQGGIVPGWAPGRDDHMVPLSGGEAIMRPEWARAMGGAAIDAMNHAAKHGGFAAGGVFRPIKKPETNGPHDAPPVSQYTAIDFAAPIGTPVYAVDSGKITRSYDITGYEPRRTGYGKAQDGYKSYGRVMYLQTDMGPEVLYAHLSRRGFDRGTHVRGGQPIGLSGDTGNSTGPHLHFGDSDGNPEEFLGGRRGRGTITGGVQGLLGSMMASSVGSFKQVMGKILKDGYPSIENAMARGMGFQFPENSISKDINRLARLDFQRMKQKAIKKGHLTGADMFGGIPQGPEGNNQHLVRRAMLDQGWHQWASLYPLVMSESGFRNTAQNPNSTAYGMFQFLDSTWKGYGGHKTSDPWTQAVLGMRYIKNRYTDPNGAWDFHKKNGWYNQGSIFTGPTQIGVGEGGAEMVLPLNHRGTDFLGELMKKHQAGLEGRGIGLGSSPMGGGMTVMNYRIDKSTTFTGPITVQANDPNELIAKLQARNRLQALVRPHTAGSAA